MLVFLSIVFVIVLCLNIYRRCSVSPSIPGPFCLPLVGAVHLIRGDSTEVLNRLLEVFDRYPDLLKCSLGGYVIYGIAKPEFIETVLNQSGACERFVLFKQIGELWGEGLLSASVPVWRRHRRIIAPSFNTKILAGFIEIFAKHSRILEKQAEHATIDVFELATNCTLDAMSESLFGVQIDAQINNKGYGLLFSKWVDIYFYRLFKVWYHCEVIFRLSKYHKMQMEYIEEIRKLAKMIIQRKQEDLQNVYQDDERKPFLEHLLTAKKYDLSYQEIEDEVITFMIAGTDTTATTLCFAMLLLGLDQNSQDRLYNEVIDVLGNDKSVEIDDLPNLKYTECVIKETLRLFPPVPIDGRETTQDFVLDDGRIIPKGVQVILPFIHVHRNPKYWPDPLKFDPERFLPEEVCKRHQCTWVPFSLGLRNCIGGKLAMMLLKTVLPIIVRRFKIETGYKSVEDVELQTNIVIKPKDGYKIALRSR